MKEFQSLPEAISAACCNPFGVFMAPCYAEDSIFPMLEMNEQGKILRLQPKPAFYLSTKNIYKTYLIKPCDHFAFFHIPDEASISRCGPSNAVQVSFKRNNNGH